MKRRLTATVLVFLVALGVAFALATASSFRPLVSLQHPEVRWVSTEELAQRLDNPTLFLVDAREPQEFAVGRIPGARLIGEAIPANAQVVVYCSVGVRSGDYAARLNARGIDAENLVGGIFAWANEDRAMENEAGPTRQVHPYNGVFAHFLDDDESIAWEP